jgi:hypothetical protein
MIVVAFGGLWMILLWGHTKTLGALWDLTKDAAAQLLLRRMTFVMLLVGNAVAQVCDCCRTNRVEMASAIATLLVGLLCDLAFPQHLRTSVEAHVHHLVGLRYTLLLL